MVLRLSVDVCYIPKRTTHCYSYLLGIPVTRQKRERRENLLMAMMIRGSVSEATSKVLSGRSFCCAFLCTTLSRRTAYLPSLQLVGRRVPSLASSNLHFCTTFTDYIPRPSQLLDRNIELLDASHHSPPHISHTIMASTVELPKELWLEIVSCLDYFDLKTIIGVSKAFKSYTELPACQKTMFRSKAVVPMEETINLDTVVLHPAFIYMSYGCATELAGVYFYTGDKIEETTKLTDTCATDEHATNPPVASLRIQVTPWPPLQLTNRDGVTVVQVMKSLCHFFSTGRHRESRGDRTGWTGWDEVKLDSNGNLWLRAIFFDS